MKTESVIPILYSNDVTRSMRYYADVLCFKERWNWDDTPTFGGVVDGDTTIFFCKGDQGYKSTWQALNVDEYYEAVKAKGDSILTPPDTKPWFISEMLVKDPDGHMLRIGRNTNRE